MFCPFLCIHNPGWKTEMFYQVIKVWLLRGICLWINSRNFKRKSYTKTIPASYIPQQNGFVRCRNTEVKAMTRCLMNNWNIPYHSRENTVIKKTIYENLAYFQLFCSCINSFYKIEINWIKTKRTRNMFIA